MTRGAWVLGALALVMSVGALIVVTEEPPEGPETVRLRGRVEELERRSEDQQARLRTLERQVRGVLEERDDAESALERVNTLREDLARVVARGAPEGARATPPAADDGLNAAPAELGPAQRQAVATVVEEVLRADRERRRQATEARATAQAGRRVEELKQLLGLDERQAQVVAEAMAWEREQRRLGRERMQEAGWSPEAWREARQATQKETDARITSVLTTDQVQRYQEWRSSRGDRGR